ncbi:unnamed protein product [Nippostrongylus brasiliensis]|uniref:Transposase n=1 Tax=Nippostrongylus brasiliensis TaxID=27835 RepID=A0A0N4YT08_NIPBR|nr:unnamed protein product [Nippostrongylus brasiliensis]
MIHVLNRDELFSQSLSLRFRFVRDEGVLEIDEGETLEWDDMEMKINARQLHHLRFADDIVLKSPSITHSE